MKKIRILFILILLAGAIYYLDVIYRNKCQKIAARGPNIKGATPLDAGLDLLRMRKDNLALAEFEKVLAADPDNIDALWGKAEVFRRAYKFNEAEEILIEILKREPKHIPSLTTTCYIRYYNNKLNEAMKLARGLLNRKDIDTRNKAIVYMLIASINARRSSQGGFFDKLSYGTQIKIYFQKAVDLSPDLSEAHLGLGSYYLMAPAIAGGNVDKAIKELELAVRLAPDFATPNARLAQAYKKKGDLNKYQFYLGRARELDPNNEALAEALK
ncbi:MAG: hypothetical protein PHU91_00255 [Candidatus Omnitrophica bacterium]|nr:hypothetical protein [Candidatus Omnitrophota bacterium]MDD5236094.1 hypothetical protein [Candidatus Omnitrophota bacterium]MDD5610550.1 hypothetical protein [Candidatus Omnitrophota bacterium]